MRISHNPRLAVTVLAILMMSSNAGAQDLESGGDPASAVSKHGELTGIFTNWFTRSELVARGSITQIVLANDKDGWPVHPKPVQLYQQAASRGRNQRADGFIPPTGQGKNEPRSAREYFRRGLERAEGDPNGAIEDFTNAIALNSYRRAPKRMRHPKSDLDDKGQPVLYEKFLVIDKFNAMAYFSIGTLLMKQGRLSEAIDNLNKAIRLHPQYGPAFNNRGRVKNLMGDVDGASSDFDRSVQLDPKNPIAYFSRAIFRHKIQDFAGAIADYTRAIEIDPQIAAAFHDRGCAYLALAKLDEAHRDFDRAIELDPELFVAYGIRGLVRILEGRDAEAEADFARYLQHAGDDKANFEALVRKARESRGANGVKASGNLPVIVP